MSKKSLLFGAIASVLTLNAFAETTTSTIPTQSYVDTNFQTKIPAGSFGANKSVVTYDANSGDVQERLILYPAGSMNEANILNILGSGHLFEDSAVSRIYKRALGATDEQYENALLPGKYIDNIFGRKQNKITPGTTGSVAIFNGENSGNGGAQFTERAIYDGSTTYDSTTDTDKLVTAGVVETKQNKMTCTQWLGDEHTDANCLLWSIN